MRSEFKAKVAIGLLGGVAILELAEHEITREGNKVDNGCDIAVKNDIEMSGTLDWFDCLRSEKATEKTGIYEITGRVKLDEDSSDYYGVKVTPIKA